MSDQLSKQSRWLLQSQLGPRFFEIIVRTLVGFMMLALAIWVASGVFGIIVDGLRDGVEEWNHQAESVIVRFLTLLAMLELWRTLHSYLEIGRVRVTFIIDAALVVLIGELIGLWYREHVLPEVALSLGVILILALIRVLTMHFSPENHPREEREAPTCQVPGDS